jgi:hypothetical protein
MQAQILEPTIRATNTYSLPRYEQSGKPSLIGQGANYPAIYVCNERLTIRPCEDYPTPSRQFSLGQELRMIALHKSQQPVATTSSFFSSAFCESSLPAPG